MLPKNKKKTRESEFSRTQFISTNKSRATVENQGREQNGEHIFRLLGRLALISATLLFVTFFITLRTVFGVYAFDNTLATTARTILPFFHLAPDPVHVLGHVR